MCERERECVDAESKPYFISSGEKDSLVRRLIRKKEPRYEAGWRSSSKTICLNHSLTFCRSLLMRLKMYSKLLGMIPRSSWVNVSESSEGPGEEGRECRVTLLRPALNWSTVPYLSW